MPTEFNNLVTVGETQDCVSPTGLHRNAAKRFPNGMRALNTLRATYQPKLVKEYSTLAADNSATPGTQSNEYTNSDGQQPTMLSISSKPRTTPQQSTETRQPKQQIKPNHSVRCKCPNCGVEGIPRAIGEQQVQCSQCGKDNYVVYRDNTPVAVVAHGPNAYNKFASKGISPYCKFCNSVLDISRGEPEYQLTCGHCGHYETHTQPEWNILNNSGITKELSGVKHAELDKQQTFKLLPNTCRNCGNDRGTGTTCLSCGYNNIGVV